MNRKKRGYEWQKFQLNTVESGSPRKDSNDSKDENYIFEDLSVIYVSLALGSPKLQLHLANLTKFFSEPYHPIPNAGAEDALACSVKTLGLPALGTSKPSMTCSWLKSDKKKGWYLRVEILAKFHFKILNILSSFTMCLPFFIHQMELLWFPCNAAPTGALRRSITCCVAKTSPIQQIWREALHSQTPNNLTTWKNHLWTLCQNGIWEMRLVFLDSNQHSARTRYSGIIISEFYAFLKQSWVMSRHNRLYPCLVFHVVWVWKRQVSGIWSAALPKDRFVRARPLPQQHVPTIWANFSRSLRSRRRWRASNKKGNQFEHKSFHKPRPSSVQFCQMDRNDLSKVILHWHLCGLPFDSEETSWQGSRVVLRKANKKYETPGNWQHFDDVKQTKRNQTTEGKLRN